MYEAEIVLIDYQRFNYLILISMLQYIKNLQKF